jgi:hypothetical protein
MLIDRFKIILFTGDGICRVASQAGAFVKYSIYYWQVIGFLPVIIIRWSSLSASFVQFANLSVKFATKLVLSYCHNPQ